MSIVVRYHPNHMTVEQYDTAVAKLQEGGGEGPPAGSDYHVCFGTDGDLHVSEIWDSREEFEAFSKMLLPVLAGVGITFTGEPEVFEVHAIERR